MGLTSAVYSLGPTNSSPTADTEKLLSYLPQHRVIHTWGETAQTGVMSLEDTPESQQETHTHTQVDCHHIDITCPQFSVSHRGTY